MLDDNSITEQCFPGNATRDDTSVHKNKSSNRIQLVSQRKKHRSKDPALS